MKSRRPASKDSNASFEPEGHSIPFRKPKAIATAEAGGKKGHSYQSLPIHFRKDGFDFRQIVREGNVAIYEQTMPGSTDTFTYEVVIIRKREGFYIGDRYVEAAEVYPSNNEWGSFGWTLQNKEAAFVKFRSLT